MNKRKLNTRKQKWTRGKKFRLAIIILISYLIVDFIGVVFYYHHVKDFVQGQKQDFRVDAVVLFFGDHNEDGDDIGIDSRNRADVAIRLFREGNVKSIISVGGYVKDLSDGKPNYMRLYLEKQGVPDSLLFSDSLSYNTITNWQEAKKIIQRKNFTSIVAISAPLHIYRISGLLDFDTVYFCSYQYRLRTFNDYLRLYDDVHHEWISYTLSAIFKGELRNKVVFQYRKFMKRFD
jgi:uncharacterized SAM-binding protein YcdF (DUF218 family)